MCPYRGAVLIIGSLWWEETEIRKLWRESRLDISLAQSVFAPIRYGRLSGKTRKNTYTMVFSTSCDEEKIGKAILVPFIHETQSLMDFLCEAQRLWEAEGGIAGRTAGKWGAVGLLIKPQVKIPDEILKGWKENYVAQKYKPTFAPVGNEKPAFEKGMLNIAWVNDVNTNQPAELDFILATATDPQSSNYPSAQDIAKSMRENAYREYFGNNQTSGIATFQDEEILKYLSAED